jgi:hypothetical protein
MFATIRHFCALFKLPETDQIKSVFKSLASSPFDDSYDPPDEASVIVEDSDLWRDYAAVGFDLGGTLQCRTANACWN